MNNAPPTPPLRGASLFLYAQQTLPALERNIKLRIIGIKSICDALFARYETSSSKEQDAEIVRSGVDAIASLNVLLEQIRQK